MVNEVQQLIATRIAGDVREGVDRGVEDELNNVRSGNAGTKFTGIEWLDSIIDAIIGMIFSMVGPETQQWMAGLAGKHIPDEKEKQALADQITDSTSRVLADVNAEGKFTAVDASPEALRAKVAEQITQDIKNNPALSFMSEEQIAKASTNAAHELTDTRVADLQKQLTSLQAGVTVTQQPLEGTPQQQVQQVLGSIISPFVPEGKKGLETPLLETASGVIAANPSLLGDSNQMAQKIMEAVNQSPQAAEAAKSIGIDMSKAENVQLLAGMLGNNREVLARAAEGSGVAASAPVVTVDVSSIVNEQIAQNVSQGIKDHAAQAVLDAYNDKGNLTSRSGIASRVRNIAVRNDEVKAAAAVLNDSSTSPDSKAAQDAADTLYTRAVQLNSAPNYAQSDKIGELAAEAAVQVLRDPANTNQTTQQLATTLEKAIDDKLRGNEKAISALGVSVERINDSWNPMGKDGDVLGDIAKNFAKTIVEDPQTAQQITIAQENLIAQDVRRVSDALDKSGLVKLNGQNHAGRTNGGYVPGTGPQQATARS